MSKRRGHGAAHHGGAWKVAYADFVTSMMALFLVLWLVGSDEATKLAVQRYFRGEINQQGKAGTKEYSRMQPFQAKIKDKVSNNLTQEDMKRALEKLREQLNNSSQDGNDLIRYDFIADGVRITVIDSSSRPFFDPGTAHITSYGEWVLKTTAWFLDRFPFMLEVEGHTQKGGIQVSADSKAEGWDLSTARAISARNLLQDAGLEPERFWRVVGYSDRIPLDGVEPDSEKNRRITIVARLKPDMSTEAAQQLVQRSEQEPLP